MERRGLLIRPGLRYFLLTWNLVFISVFCDAVGIFLLKLTLTDLGEVPVRDMGLAMGYLSRLLMHPVAVIGLLLFLAAPFFFAAALSRMDVSTAYPVQVGLNFIVLVLLAVVFLGEVLTLAKLTGITLVVMSLFFLYDA